MNSLDPELALERLLLAMEKDVLEASDEEILEAARELGINPAMKASSAFFGILKPYPVFGQSGADTTGRGPGPGRARRNQTYTKGRPITREQVFARLAMLSPHEASVLRARFGIDMPGQSPDEEEVVLHALARELAILQRKQ